MGEPTAGGELYLRSVPTLDENFESWDRFLAAYYEPIRTALGLLPFVGRDLAEDVAQDFFLKMHRRDLLANRPAIEGRFRDWLYVAARNHALDECRKIGRRRERPDAFEVNEPADPRPAAGDDGHFVADELYALSVLHMTVGRVRKHCLQEGMAEHWMIFEELVLAPLIPGRAGKTRDELLAMFPNERPNFLNNRITTVYRAFCRILPASIPVDPTERLTPEQRFEELLAILRSSATSRLWLALLQAPALDEEASPGSSIDLAVRSFVGVPALTVPSSETLHDELRILLGFWLEMPLAEYLDDPEKAGPAVAVALRGSRPSGAGERSAGASPSAPSFNLRMLIGEAHAAASDVPCPQLTALLDRVKTFAKRVHRPRKHRPADRGEAAPVAGRLEDSMPFEIAQVLYNLAGALALTRCDARIIGLSDDQFRKNIAWVLNQSWLDARLRPVFYSALSRLRPAASG